jgi:hypothetical protein
MVLLLLLRVPLQDSVLQAQKTLLNLEKVINICFLWLEANAIVSTINFLFIYSLTTLDWPTFSRLSYGFLPILSILVEIRAWLLYSVGELERIWSTPWRHPSKNSTRWPFSKMLKFWHTSLFNLGIRKVTPTCLPKRGYPMDVWRRSKVRCTIRRHTTGPTRISKLDIICGQTVRAILNIPRTTHSALSPCRPRKSLNRCRSIG